MIIFVGDSIDRAKKGSEHEVTSQPETEGGKHSDAKTSDSEKMAKPTGSRDETNMELDSKEDSKTQSEKSEDMEKSPLNKKSEPLEDNVSSPQVTSSQAESPAQQPSV